MAMTVPPSSPRGPNPCLRSCIGGLSRNSIPAISANADADSKPPKETGAPGSRIGLEFDGDRGPSPGAASEKARLAFPWLVCPPLEPSYWPPRHCSRRVEAVAPRFFLPADLSLPRDLGTISTLQHGLAH